MFSTHLCHSDMERCNFCRSINLIEHTEGVTCGDCARVSEEPYFGFEPVIKRDSYSSEKIDIHPELAEIVSRMGIPSPIVTRIEYLSTIVKSYFRTTSGIDLILISIYQAYLEHRTFISIAKLKYFYPTKSSTTVLNNLHFKIVEKQIFKATSLFSKCEIISSIVEYFRLSQVDFNRIVKQFDIFYVYTSYMSVIHIVGCVYLHLFKENIIDTNVSPEQVFTFLAVKRNTILLKLKEIKNSKYFSQS